jgi:hypothetical protein
MMYCRRQPGLNVLYRAYRNLNYQVRPRGKVTARVWGQKCDFKVRLALLSLVFAMACLSYSCPLSSLHSSFVLLAEDTASRPSGISIVLSHSHSTHPRLLEDPDPIAPNAKDMPCRKSEDTKNYACLTKQHMSSHGYGVEGRRSHHDKLLLEQRLSGQQP